jgi:hypothetical protein
MPRKPSGGAMKLTDDEVKQLQQNLQKKIAKFPIPDRWQGFLYIEFPCPSTAAPSNCPSSCPTCSDQYIPSQSRVAPNPQGIEPHDDATAATVIKTLRDNTKSDLEYLRGKIMEYGDGIIKRWQKRISTKKAEDLLRAAKPDIFPDSIF